jgi:alpha-tubulin suppressor-like RCC1 family protein
MAPPGGASAIAVNAGNNQSAVAGTSVNIAPSVKVTDASANPVSGVAVTFAVASGGGSVTGPNQTTNASGIAAVASWTLGPAVGTNTLTATAVGLTGSPVTFTATGETGGDGSGFSVLSAGFDFTCALTSGGTAYCWGRNSYGTLGDGTTTDQRVPVPVAGSLSFVAISAGGFHACGLTADGRAYCWGDNRFSQLGDGTTESRLTPVSVAGGLTFASLSAGGDNTCGVTTQGAIYCWRQTYSGVRNPELVPVLVPSPASFSTINASTAFGCGLTTAGAAHCWGGNAYGELGDGTTNPRASPGPVSGALTFGSLTAGWGGWNHTCGLTAAGVAYCWGLNESGQIGDGTRTHALAPVAVAGNLTFAQVEAGSGQTCGITPAHVAYCWGENSAGQLGDGTTKTRSTPVSVTGGLSFTAISAGLGHTCGITAAGEAYCWGTDGFGGVQHTPTLVQR